MILLYIEEKFSDVQQTKAKPRRNKFITLYYICHHASGNFEFDADSRQLALDHARQWCDLNGLIYRRIERCQAS
jgi:hypothetical protein